MTSKYLPECLECNICSRNAGCYPLILNTVVILVLCWFTDSLFSISFLVHVVPSPEMVGTTLPHPSPSFLFSVTRNKSVCLLRAGQHIQLYNLSTMLIFKVWDILICETYLAPRVSNKTLWTCVW